MNEIYIALGGLISTFGAAFFAFIFARRKYNADARVVEVTAKTTEIDNEIKLSNYHKDMLDDLKPRYEKQFLDYQITVAAKEKLLQEEITLLRRENKILKRQIVEKDREIRERDKRITELEKMK